MAAAAQMLQGLAVAAPSRVQASKLGLASSSASCKPATAAAPCKRSGAVVRASADNNTETKPSLLSSVGSGLAAVGLAAALQFAPLSVGPASATEFQVLRSEPPLESHFFDDAGVLSRVTRSDLKRLLTTLENDTGYHVDVVTLRKLAGKGDVFELADKILEAWYPTVEVGDKRGVVLLVTSAKEGALAGGPSFLDAVGDDLIEAIVSENLPVLATEEKYNEAIYSTAKRLVARFTGQPDIPGPQFNDSKRESNFKTKSETAEKRDQFAFVVGGLLVIAFVVPMLQYYAYVSGK